MKKILLKVFTFLICSAVSAGVIVNFPSQENSAKTIPEIQEERKQNEEKIAEYEKQISDLSQNLSDEQEVQQVLSEQIVLIQQNISLLNQELEKLENDITSTNDNIEFLDYSITEHQKQIDESIEVFKKRLCAMYMTGNHDNMISVVLGSESFYDMMTRLKVVNNMAEYDEKLISDILNDINNLEKDRKDLEAKLAEQKTKKSEKTSEIQSLNEKMEYSKAVVEQITAQQNKIQNSKEDAEKLREEFDKQEQEIQDEIRRKAEEAQKKYEEEQRRKQQEELKRKQEELLKKQQEEQEKLYQKWLENQVPPQNESLPIPEPSEQPYVWPTPNYYYITSYYGEREGLQHRGIDVGDADIDGADVVAVRDGIVISVNNSCEHNYGKDGSCGCGGDFGNYVIISHDGTYSTIYAHMAYTTVSVGDYVQQGQKIGAVGSTGWSTGPHLHFELRVNGVDVNPLDYINP